MIRLQRSALLPYTLLAAVIFYIMQLSLGVDTLIVVLNGALIGALAAITMTYSRVIRSWFVGDRADDGVSMFGFFFLLLWAVVGMFIVNSIYVRAADLPYTVLLTTAIGRYILIICAWGLIGSIDYGEAWLYGRDQKQLAGGLVLGTIVAGIVIYIQKYQVLT